LLIINCAISLLGAGLYGVLFYLDDYTLHGKTIEVPNLIGKQIEEVDSLLDGGAFTQLIADSIFEKGVKGGMVLEQNPSPNYQVKQGRKIYLTISAYEPPKIELPNLIDLSLRQATSLIETYGLQLGNLSYQPDPCTNCILEVFLKGEKVSEGERIEKGAQLDLLVGQGLSNELTDIPYLIGFEVDMADQLLKTKFLNVGSLIYDETVENAEDSTRARVYKYTPFYSEEPVVPMGSSIDLFLTADTNRIVHTVNLQDSI
jgi:beta-lactam-binding protein with PASTA domain